MRDADFEALYEREAQPLFGFLAYRTGDRALAEDLLADTFERALRARGRYDRRRGSERTWLYAIALNLLRDHARRAAAEGRAVERAGHAPAGVGAAGDPADVGRRAEGRRARGRRGVGAAGDLDDVERRDEVRRAMAGLAEEEREAIALRFGAELTVPEMAKLL